MSKLHPNYIHKIIGKNSMEEMSKKHPNLDIKKLRRAYTLQRWIAVCDRKIVWNFTFESWLELWVSSGHIHQRGRGKYDYVLSRYNDQGEYSPKNCFVQTNWENTLEGKNFKYMV